jgi:hypothetical protein
MIRRASSGVIFLPAIRRPRPDRAGGPVPFLQLLQDREGDAHALLPQGGLKLLESGQSAFSSKIRSAPDGWHRQR